MAWLVGKHVSVPERRVAVALDEMIVYRTSYCSKGYHWTTLHASTASHRTSMLSLSCSLFTDFTLTHQHALQVQNVPVSSSCLYGAGGGAAVAVRSLTQSSQTRLLGRREPSAATTVCRVLEHVSHTSLPHARQW